MVALAVSYCGLLLVFGREASLVGPQVALGAALVFASTLSYGLYLLYSAEVLRRLGSMRLTGWASSVACVLCLLQFVLLRPIEAAAVAPPVLWLSVLNALVCTVAPVWMVMMAIERVGPSTTAQAGMIGPLSTILMGVWLLGEPFTAWIALGTLFVLGGIGLLVRSR